MPNPENELPHAQFVQVIFNGIADWVGKYRHNFGLDSQFGLCTPDEVMRIARDLRLTQGELQELARKAPNAADLLLKMLVALHVALENTDPHVMRDLRRLCTTCGAKKRCEHELADGTAGDHFREFCPNAFTLDALLEGSILGVNNRAQSHAWSTIMTKSARIADLERLEDDIDEALLHCPNDDSQMFVELRRRQSHLKEEIERLRHEVLGDRTLH